MRIEGFWVKLSVIYLSKAALQYYTTHTLTHSFTQTHTLLTPAGAVLHFAEFS